MKGDFKGLDDIAKIKKADLGTSLPEFKSSTLSVTLRKLLKLYLHFLVCWIEIIIIFLL